MNDRNRQIDGLRGAAITVIVLYHMIYRFAELYLDKTIPVMSYWGAGGGIGLFVDIVLLSDKFWIRKSFGDCKKIFRLWPSYIVAITLIQITITFFPLPGRICKWIEYGWNIAFINGFIGIAYVDGAHWYITTLISLLFITGFFKIIKIQNKEITYLIWMICVICLSKVFHSDLTHYLGGSYVGIASIGIAINHIDWINLKKA